MKEMRTSRSLLVIAGSLAFSLLPSLFPFRVLAEEGGAPTCAPGSLASFMDALPSEPGFAVFNSFVYYSGDASASRQIPIAGQNTVKGNYVWFKLAASL